MKQYDCIVWVRNNLSEQGERKVANLSNFQLNGIYKTKTKENG